MVRPSPTTTVPSAFTPAAVLKVIGPGKKPRPWKKHWGREIAGVAVAKATTETKTRSRFFFHDGESVACMMPSLPGARRRHRAGVAALHLRRYFSCSIQHRSARNHRLIIEAALVIRRPRIRAGRQRVMTCTGVDVLSWQPAGRRRLDIADGRASCCESKIVVARLPRPANRIAGAIASGACGRVHEAGISAALVVRAVEEVRGISVQAGVHQWRNHIR